MANINDEPEHLFDQVVRIGYGIEICKYLWWHDLAALACVDRQCAEAVRWQREKGNTKAIWSRDIDYRVTFRYKDINVMSEVPIKNIEDIDIKTYTINDRKTSTNKDKKYMRAIRKKKVILDQYDRIIVIQLNRRNILVNYEDKDTILDSWKYFCGEQKIREKEKQKIREKEEQLRQKRFEIYLEEESKKWPEIYLEEERKKWSEIYLEEERKRWRKIYLEKRR